VKLIPDRGERDFHFLQSVNIGREGPAQLLSSGQETTSESSRVTEYLVLTSHIYLWPALRINRVIPPFRHVRWQNALEQLRNIRGIWYQNLLFTNWCTIELL